MSNGQWLDLPERTFAKSCNIKVTPLGYRLPFATNQTNTGYANSQLVVQIATAVGLDTKFNCFTIPYKWNASDETKPVVEDSSDIDKRIIKTIWGGKTSEDPTNMSCCIGIPRRYNNYTLIVTPKNDTTFK